jgi:hypothetical protein
MKKTIRKGVSLLALCAVGFTSQAQQFTATMLEFTNQHYIEHEFGFSSVEFNGYSIYGTEFNQTVNIHKDNALLFQVVSPFYHQPDSRSFGHAVGMNEDWVAITAYQDDVTPSNTASDYEGRVYLSKNINGVPQNNFTLSITAQTPENRDQFGEVIDMYGEWMVIGAPSNGNIYDGNKGYIEIWKQTANSWERKHKIQADGLPAGAKYGSSVAIHGDYIVVGAPNAQKVFVYKNTNGVWALHSSFTPDMSTWARVYDSSNQKYYSSFGNDVDIYGNKIIVGDHNQAVQKAAILTINTNTTTLSHTLLPLGYSESAFTHYGFFGNSVAINDDRAIVSAPYEYGPDISHTKSQGQVFFYTDNFQYVGYMNVGTPAGKKIGGLGRSVDMNGDYVLVGAEFTDNTITNRDIEGVAFRMPFYYITQTGNTPPSITITSPNINSSYNAPATITIEAYANDPDGTITGVEFYRDGGIYLGTDNTAPYTFTLTNVSAGNKYFYVRTYDNNGAMTLADVAITVNSTLPPAIISGPACGSKNQTLQFELDASKRVNATGFNWYYTGSNQGITPVSGAAYKANLATGNNFSAGQICVGVNYSSAPWHATYCINVGTCAALREGTTEQPLLANKSISFPNPFNTTSTIEFAHANAAAKIQVLNAAGAVVLKTEATGSFTFGNDLKAGMYIVIMEFGDKTETIKVVKE